jgi:hypothetical protein
MLFGTAAAKRLLRSSGKRLAGLMESNCGLCGFVELAA